MWDDFVMPERRSLDQRILDARKRFENDIDCWVATADSVSSSAYLIPLSHLWDGEALWLATYAKSRTGRNILATGSLRLGFGPTRDVVMVEGEVTLVPRAEITDAVAEPFAIKTGFDPRASEQDHIYIRLVPRRIQAWREENELADRTIMRDGHWISGD